MIKKYIDCDGVILDTETDLFKEYDKLIEQGINITRRKYLQELDWNLWIYQAKILNNSIELLNSYDYKDTSILTKVHSMQEAMAKITYFRNLKIKNDIIIVPYDLKKSDVVSASGNILVDDYHKNLNEWQLSGGIPIYFGTEELGYPKINTLEEVLSNDILKRIRKKC